MIRKRLQDLESGGGVTPAGPGHSHARAFYVFYSEADFCFSFPKANLAGCIQTCPFSHLRAAQHIEKEKDTSMIRPPCSESCRSWRARLGWAEVCFKKLDHSQSFQLPCAALTFRDDSRRASASPRLALSRPEVHVRKQAATAMGL